MIYLIKVLYHDEETNQALPLLKVGYARSIDDRMKAYYTANPRAKLIDTREGGYEVERSLHLLFKKYQYIDEHSREWFYYNEEIINNFHVDINDSLIEKNVAISSVFECFPMIDRSIISELNKAKCMDDITRLLENALGRNLEEKEMDNFLETYSKVNGEFVEVERKLKEDSDYKKAEEIIDGFIENKFSSTGIFEVKLKYFCEFVEEHKDDIYIRKSLRYKIPDFRYHNYYNLLGIDECKAKGWRYLDIRNHISDCGKRNEVSTLFQKEFIEGRRYTRKAIKLKIREIYNILGVNSSPKASDIEKYFNIKEIQIVDPVTKQRDRGYEIISIK